MPSRWPRRLLTGALLLTLVALAATPLRGPVLGGLLATSLALLWLELRLQRRGPEVARLVWQDGQCWLYFADAQDSFPGPGGEPLAVALDCAARLPWLLVLDWRGAGRRGRLLVWPDSLDQDAWRELRVRCG
ncbi:MAG TPA: protein YgfX [Spongiibacteraceae bacterium]|jgi:hypothetical protein|nr:hypothetical protein [Spongiibacteraceae bacterium]HUH38880.1 protein YgfX [Spongiibacteraceae bacterium]